MVEAEAGIGSSWGIGLTVRVSNGFFGYEFIWFTIFLQCKTSKFCPSYTRRAKEDLAFDLKS